MGRGKEEGKGNRRGEEEGGRECARRLPEECLPQTPSVGGANYTWKGPGGIAIEVGRGGLKQPLPHRGHPQLEAARFAHPSSPSRAQPWRRRGGPPKAKRCRTSHEGQRAASSCGRPRCYMLNAQRCR